VSVVTGQVHAARKQSLTTASIAKQLALRVDDADPMDCFIAGLLHDLGKVVFAQFMPREFRKALEHSQWNEAPLHLALREVIGVDHAVVGAMLVERWRFSSSLVETIQHQYGTVLKDTGMIACVFAANQISKKLKLGFGGNLCVDELPPATVKRLGGSLDEVISSLGDLAPTLEEAKIFANF
jgi:putative nucleotidyltransferase with HDIG domain